MGALSRGLTLVETIIGIFILIAGFLVMGAMFHAALRHTARMEARQLAVVLAEKKLEEVKGWSAATHTSAQPFSDWSGLAAAIPAQDPDYPGYEVTITPVDPGGPVLYSPCSQFELSVTPAERRGFTLASVRPVRIQVAWSGGEHELVSLVAAPPALPGVIEVTPNVSGVARDAQQPFTAVAKDSFGRVLPDSKFRWFVRGSGNGTKSETRNGQGASLLHRIDVAGLTGYGSGACQMVAVGLIGGRRVEGVSSGLTLP